MYYVHHLIFSTLLDYKQYSSENTVLPNVECSFPNRQACIKLCDKKVPNYTKSKQFSNYSLHLQILKFAIFTIRKHFNETVMLINLVSSLGCSCSTWYTFKTWTNHNYLTVKITNSWTQCCEYSFLTFCDQRKLLFYQGCWPSHKMGH